MKAAGWAAILIREEWHLMHAATRNGLTRSVNQNFDTPCPHCGYRNSFAIHGTNVPAEPAGVWFRNPCDACGRGVYYRAVAEVTVHAATTPEGVRY